jgi:hypothetical protein
LCEGDDDGTAAAAVSFHVRPNGDAGEKRGAEREGGTICQYPFHAFSPSSLSPPAPLISSRRGGEEKKKRKKKKIPEKPRLMFLLRSSV